MTSKIEQQVMASVGVIYIARKLTSRIALECYALLLSFAGAAYFVSLPNVIANFAHVAQGGLVSIGAFLVAAVLGTKLVVQIAVIVGAGALLAMVADIVRSTPASRSLIA
ncbi:MAG TPA: hypothetical protein VG984_03960 [Candidatus Paceibacterota bacterium]|nr:hypothetical protein [Candidatus Paceibacterota bacterium]